MNRNEIAWQLRQWIAGGLLKSKKATGLTYAAINKAIASGELLPTSFEGIVATDKTIRDKFEGLVNQRRILDGKSIKVHKGLLTLYAINLSCANGELLRFPDFGKSNPLYID